MGVQPPIRDFIFLSYRRNDARGASGRLYDWLRISFGRERVFRDVNNISVGPWREKIDVALSRCRICVAVIGPRWADADNVLRLSDESDMVRLELMTALATDGLVVVPTLVEGAEVPKATALPAELRPLFDIWNARRVTEDGWEDDTRRLIKKIADAAGFAIGPDVDALLRNVGAAERRIAELEQERRLQIGQIVALRHTVDDLTRKVAEASLLERPGLVAAFEALARGDSRAAEEAFEREYDAQSRTADDARRTKAEAARNVANLALLHDVSKAVEFYRKALNLEAGHAETARLLGGALIVSGDLAAARAALSRSLELATIQGDAWGEFGAHGLLGDVLRRLGYLKEAIEAYSKAIGVATRQLELDPASADLEWLRALFVSYNSIGEVLDATGDRPGAEASYWKGLEIAEVLRSLNPAVSFWQRDFSYSHERIGDMLMAQRNLAGAEEAYRKAFALREALASRNPADAQRQRDLSIGHTKIGNVRRAQGDAAGAEAAYLKALSIIEDLASRDPANTARQRDLLVSYEKLGDVLISRGDAAGGAATYRKALAIGEKLVAHDPSNTAWQRDLLVSAAKVGDVLLAQGDGRGAEEAYRKSVAIGEALLARDPTNATWHYDLSVCFDKIGNASSAQGDTAAAEIAYRKGLAIAEALAARDPANAALQRNLMLQNDKVGDVLVDRDDLEGAEAAYRNCLAIAEALATHDPPNVDWQSDLTVASSKLRVLQHGKSLVARESHSRRAKDRLLKWLSTLVRG